MTEETTQDARDPWLDRVIDSRYRIAEKIGRGGMGSVYKVFHTQIAKVAALKILHGALSSDGELIKRFHREAQAISRLSHPNIVQVFDFGKVEDTIYLVMEYLKGEDLSAILRRDGPLGFERSASILVQICDALTEAHDLGVVHRDLKPENVRVSRTRDGHDFVKVMDFGLAKILVEGEPDPAITARGNLVGTPYYMAPELIRGKALDHRCDVYSVGAMLYRMMTGENAFMANTPVGVLTKHITEEVVPPSQRAPELRIPPEVDGIVMRAMAKDREQRHESAAALKQHLIAVLGESPPGAFAPPGLSSRALVVPPQRRASDALSDSQRARLEEQPTGRIDESGVIGHAVLSREDLAFERRLRWSWLIKLLLLIPALGAVGFAAYWYGFRETPVLAPLQEVEPNNNPAEASLIANSSPVSGHLGKRVSINESDRDWYKLQVRGSGPQTLRVSVSRIPNMDITVELRDAAGGVITRADSAPANGGEVITNWSVDPGRYYLLVREVWKVGAAATENVTDSYRLAVDWWPHENGWEMEPNDRPDQAAEVSAGETFHGYLGAVDDRDHVLVRSEAGRLGGVVSGITGVDLVLRIHAGKGKPMVVDNEAASAPESFKGIDVDGQSPARIEIMRKHPEKPESPGIEPGGFRKAAAYKLEVWVKPEAAAGM